MQKEKNVGIKTLKPMHKILDKTLIKWMKTISSTLKNEKFSKYDMKPHKPVNKKYKKKARKGKKDNRLVICEDTRSNIIKDTKPDIKKDTKPDIKIDKKNIITSA